MKFTINAQDYIIDNILESIPNSIIGMAIDRSWNYKLKNRCTIVFTLKENEKLDPAVLFWFGFFAGQD